MSKIFPKGLILLSLLCLSFSGCFLLADTIMERRIENSGTKLIGAKVEVGEVDLSYSPAGMTILNLQITNPKDPMKNAFEISRIDCSIDPWNFLMGRVIIDDMEIDGVKFDTPRASNGAMEIKPQSKIAGAILNSVEIINSKEILQKENLRSQGLVKSIEYEIKTKEAKWKQRFKEMIDEEKYEGYRQRIEALKSDGKFNIKKVVEGINEIKQIQREILADIKKFKEVKEEFNKDIEGIKAQIQQIEPLAGEDLSAIKAKYGLSQEPSVTPGNFLFTYEAEKKTNNNLFWYNKFVSFIKDKENTPFQPENESEKNPDLLIRRANVYSIETKLGILEGNFKNISSDKREPVEFNFYSCDANRNIEFRGKISHSKSGRKDIIKFYVKDAAIKELVISENEKIPVIIKEGAASFDLTADLGDNDLNIVFRTDITSAKFLLEGGGKDKPLIDIINSALANISQIHIEGDMRGTITDYKIKIKSNLDELLREAVNQIAIEQAGALERELKAAIAGKLKISLSELEKELKNLSGLDKDINSYTDALNKFM